VLLRFVTYESFMSSGKKYIKILQISVYYHSTTDVYSNNMAYMRERDWSYIKNFYNCYFN